MVGVDPWPPVVLDCGSESIQFDRGADDHDGCAVLGGASFEESELSSDPVSIGVQDGPAFCLTMYLPVDTEEGPSLEVCVLYCVSIEC